MALFDGTVPLIILAPAAPFFIAALISLGGIIYRAKKSQERNGNDESYRTPKYSSSPYSSDIFDKIDRISEKSCNCTTSKTAQACVEQLYSMQHEFEINGASAYLRNYLASEIKEAEENAHDLAKEEWEEKANKVLSNFIGEFSYVTSEYNHNFGKIEDILKSSKRCMKLWHDYWSIPFGEIYLDVDPHKYLEEYLEDDFEPCMHSSDALKKRLDAATEKLKPEHKRKMQIYDDIVQYVVKHDNIMRCELLKHRFKNATDKEVRYCYNDLIKKYRLVETKIGSRYFVSLSDKEKKKQEKQTQKSGT